MTLAGAPSWFKGPVGAGVVNERLQTNGCVRVFEPANDVARSIFAEIGKQPVFVLMPGSRFAGWALRRSPRGGEFCLARFNLAFPRKFDPGPDPELYAPAPEGILWAMAVFEAAGAQVDPPAWAPDFDPDRKTWEGVARYLIKWRHRRPSYTPQYTLKILQEEKLPIPPGLLEEIAEWEKEGRLW